MIAFLGNRLVRLVLTLLLVSNVLFSLQPPRPSDLADVIHDSSGRPPSAEDIRRHLELDQPVHYVDWVKNVLSGNLGEPLALAGSVAELLLKGLPASLQLALMAMMIGLAIGVPLGVASAARKGGVRDRAVNGFVLLGLSLPDFLLGLALILLMSVVSLPAPRYVPFTEDWGQSLASTIMPALALGMAVAAVLARGMREASPSSLPHCRSI